MGPSRFVRATGLGKRKTPLNSKPEKCYSEEFVAHWCTILLSSVHPKSVAGSAQTFATSLKKSLEYVVQRFIPLTKLLSPYTSRSTNYIIMLSLRYCQYIYYVIYIYIYIYIYIFHILYENFTFSVLHHKYSYICIIFTCILVCVSERERETEREKKNWCWMGI